MSDDLISRKETVKMLRDYADLKCFNGEVELANGILKAVCYIENDNIPTAYDVDKVIEKLEELREMVPVNRLLDDIIKDRPKELGQLMAYRKAIEIVKSGGVADE